MSTFNELISFRSKLKPGKLYPENQKFDGSDENPFIMPMYFFDENVNEFIDAVYDLSDENPENKGGYFKVLENNNIDARKDDLEKLDVTNLSNNVILNLLKCIICQEKFCDGLINEYIENGCFDKWLKQIEDNIRIN